MSAGLLLVGVAVLIVVAIVVGAVVYFSNRPGGGDGQ